MNWECLGRFGTRSLPEPTLVPGVLGEAVTMDSWPNRIRFTVTPRDQLAFQKN